jgi:hypothetical protein
MKGERVTVVFMAGHWWRRIQPVWVKGHRPAARYELIGESK